MKDNMRHKTMPLKETREQVKLRSTRIIEVTYWIFFEQNLRMAQGHLTIGEIISD